MQQSSGKKVVIAIIFLMGILMAGLLSVVMIIKSIYSQEYVVENPIVSKVGQSFEYLGTTTRKLPEVSDGGLDRYPTYGTTLKKLDTETDEEFTALKQAILKENSLLTSVSSASMLGDCDNYNKIDENGYLYLNGQPVLDDDGAQRKLYKHSSASGMYYGDVADDEQAIIKKITITPRGTNGNYITGLYAPAGEIVKIEISQSDLEATGGFMIYIGQVLANGQANNIWMARDFNRMPVIVNKLPVNKTVCYAGSYLGGPIYIGTPSNINSTFSVTISGAVPYSHFVLGVTTPEEFEQNNKSSAPAFDLEVFDDAIRFSGQKQYVENYTYDDLYKTATLWEKIALVSNKVPTGSNSSIGITFLFDPFVASGSAVAFVGRNTVNCPTSWLEGCLNYDSFVTNGSWGNIHEYNHHYQRFGLENNGEVTNNAVSLVEYSLFTKISANRTVEKSNFDSGWNRFTDPSRALNETLTLSKSGNPITSLSAYADVLHAFGQELFINATQVGGGSNGTDVWFKSLSNTMHYDFTYYFEDVLNLTITDSVKAEIKNKNYPMFVPVASVYQTGRSFKFNGTTMYSKTVQPFEIVDGLEYEFDILNSIKIPEGFSVKIKSVSNPKYGTLKKLNNGNYSYKFEDNSTSGKMYVVCQITKLDNAFDVDDVELVLEFNKKLSEDQKSCFESEYFYLPTYNLDSDNVSEKGTLVQTNFEPWDETTTINNMFDSDDTNFFHSKQNVFVSESNPFELTVDMGKVVQANKMTLVGRATNTQTPISFKLYAGLSVNNMALVGEYENVSLANGKDAVVQFETTKFQYYKLFVTKTNTNRYVCLHQVQFLLAYDGFLQISPDSKNISYSGNWKSNNVASTFGKVYSATIGKVEFEFEGTEFVVVSKNLNNKKLKFKVSIDGSKFEKVTIDSSDVGAIKSYISKTLSPGKHKVVIKACYNFNIDSIATR